MRFGPLVSDHRLLCRATLVGCPKHVKWLKYNKCLAHGCLRTRTWERNSSRRRPNPVKLTLILIFILFCFAPPYWSLSMSRRQDRDNHCKWAAGLSERCSNLSGPSGGGRLEGPAVSASSQWYRRFVISSSRSEGAGWKKCGEAAIVLRQIEGSQKNKQRVG